MPKSGRLAAAALPLTLKDKSSPLASESKSAADVWPTAVLRKVPEEPIVPSRWESLPTVSRLPAVAGDRNVGRSTVRRTRRGELR